jgi:hypothetical protein
MNFPNTGRPGNLLAILIPGVFVLFNLALGLYYLFPNEWKLDRLQEITKSNALVVVVTLLLLCFAYLIGVILRLCRTEIPDNISAWYIRTFCRRIRKEKEKPLFVTEHFPYIRWLGVVCEQNYPRAAHSFYKQFWEPRANVDKNRPFLNLCKTALLAIDSKASSEIYAAEALNRYIAGMFYGLLFSIIILTVVIVKEIWQTWSFPILIAVLDVIYLSACILILRHYRFIRIKEVETVFAATYAQRDKLPFQ